MADHFKLSQSRRTEMRKDDRDPHASSQRFDFDFAATTPSEKTMSHVKAVRKARERTRMRHERESRVLMRVLHGMTATGVILLITAIVVKVLFPWWHVFFK